MDLIAFADTSDTIQLSYPNRWAHMYDYIEVVTKTMKPPPQAIRENNGRNLDEEVYNEKPYPLNIEHYFTELSTGSTNSYWLSFHFAFKTLKFDLILDLNIIFSDLLCKIQLFHSCIQIEFFYQNFSFAHEWPAWQAC